MSSTDVVKLCHALHVYVAVTLCHAPLPSHCRQGHCVPIRAGLLCVQLTIKQQHGYLQPYSQFVLDSFNLLNPVLSILLCPLHN